MTDDLTRRRFLTGLVAAAAGSEIIIQATPVEVARFSRKDVVGLAAVRMPDFRHRAFIVGLNERLFNEEGECVGNVSYLCLRKGEIDVPIDSPAERRMLSYAEGDFEEIAQVTLIRKV